MIPVRCILRFDDHSFEVAGVRRQRKSRLVFLFPVFGRVEDVALVRIAEGRMLSGKVGIDGDRSFE